LVRETKRPPGKIIAGVVVVLVIVVGVVILLTYPSIVYPRVTVTGTMSFTSSGYNTLFSTPLGVITNGTYMLTFRQTTGQCTYQTCLNYATLTSCPQACTYSVQLLNSQSFIVTLEYTIPQQTVHNDGYPSPWWTVFCYLTGGIQEFNLNVQGSAYNYNLVCSS
jgi:hypothetical protein